MIDSTVPPAAGGRAASATPASSKRGRRRAVHAVLVLAWVAVLSVVLGAWTAEAAEAVTWAGPVAGPVRGFAALAVNDLPTIVSNLRNWVMGILAGLATLFLTIGGVRYLLAGGDPGEVERAKGAFRSAAVGYVLAVIAPVVLTVLQSIIGG